MYERRDKQGILRGYTLHKGNAKYKASELGVGRNLMASKLPFTWQKLHYQSGVITWNNQPESIQPVQKPSVTIDYPRYRSDRPNMVPYTLSHEGKNHRFYIPEKVLDCFNDEFSYRFIANCQALTDMTVAFLLDYWKRPLWQLEVWRRFTKRSSWER